MTDALRRYWWAWATVIVLFLVTVLLSFAVSDKAASRADTFHNQVCALINSSVKNTPKQRAFWERQASGARALSLVDHGNDKRRDLLLYMQAQHQLKQYDANFDPHSLGC